MIGYLNRSHIGAIKKQLKMDARHQKKLMIGRLTLILLKKEKKYLKIDLKMLNYIIKYN